MTRYQNLRPIKWREDEDGHLRVTICALKEGVFDYGCEETPQANEILSDDNGRDIIHEYIPSDAMSDAQALATLEGKDIIVGGHEWQTADNFGDGAVVGSVAGTPHVEDGELLVDAIIKSPDAIEKIKRGEYIEVSAGYDGDLLIEPGEFDGHKYDAMQTNFRFNHILLLPSGRGRLGEDVRIVNSKQERESGMATTLRRRFGNTERTFRFQNEDDAKEAEIMVEEERKFNAEQVEASLAAQVELKAKIEDLQRQLAEHDANLRAAKEELEKATSEEIQEVLAAEMADQSLDEENLAVDEAMADAEEEGKVLNEDELEKKTEEFLNSIRKPNGKRASLAQRRENCVRAVMARRGAKEIPASWGNEAFTASFETMALSAASRNDARQKNTARVINGRMVNAAPVINKGMPDARERMMNAWKIKTGGK